MTRIRLFLCIIAISMPSLAAAQQAMKFEESAAMLAASCGKDIDDNCRGVNLDATRLRECLSRNQDVVSAKCKADYPTGFRRHPAAHHRARLPGETVQLGTEQAVRRGANRSGQGPAMPAGIHQEGDAELQQGDHCCGVSLMRSGRGGCATSVLLLGALSLLAWPTAAARADGRCRPPTSSRSSPSDAGSRISTWLPCASRLPNASRRGRIPSRKSGRRSRRNCRNCRKSVSTSCSIRILP